MPKKTTELPDDADTLNAMIAALAVELNCPADVYPHLVELGRIPAYVYGENRGCDPSGLDEYRAGQRWRRKVIAALKRKPEWVACWLAERELDRRIEALCELKQLRFKPWETPPWRAGDEPPGHPAMRLRRALIAELGKAAGQEAPQAAASSAVSARW